MLTTPARYAATMALLIDIRERPPIGANSQPIAQNPDPALIEGQKRLLVSNEVLRRTVEHEQLQLDPEFGASKTPSFADKLKALVGLKPPGPAAVTIDAIVEALKSAITVKHSEKSYVLDIEVLGSSPEKAERLARALAAAYFETQSKLADDIVEKETTFVDNKLKDLHARLIDAELKAEDYRKTHALHVADGHILPEDQLKSANMALIEAHRKRADQEAKYAQLQAAVRNGGSIEQLSEAINSPTIEKFRADYAALAKDAAYAQATLGPRHPSYVIVKAQMETLRRQIAAELRRVAGSVASDLKASRSSERSAENVVADLKGQIDHQGDDRLSLAELNRQASALREQYEKTLAARENLRRDAVSSPNGVLINQPQALKGKVSPKAIPALLLALAGGLNLFVGWALVLEFLERRRLEAEAPEAAPPPKTTDRARSLAREALGAWGLAGARRSDSGAVADLPDFDLPLATARPKTGQKTGADPYLRRGRRDLRDAAGRACRERRRRRRDLLPGTGRWGLDAGRVPGFVRLRARRSHAAARLRRRASGVGAPRPGARRGRAEFRLRP